MRMEIGLSQAQVQKQILSPQMIQSMEILVLNSQQLEERIEEALEENIALEVEDPTAEASAEAGAEGEATEVADADLTSIEDRSDLDSTESATEADSEAEVDAAEMELLEDRYDHLAEFQDEESYHASGRVSGGGDEDDKFEALQNAADHPDSLHMHLQQQLRLISELPDRGRILSSEIIYNLDHRGWLLYPLEEIHEALNKETRPSDNGELTGPPVEAPITLEELQQAWEVVRGLDPCGVGAVDLRDCLSLQLERDPLDYPLELDLIANHLPDIAKNRIPQIAKATSRSIEEVKDAIEIIASLNPNPGKGFSTEQTAVVRPDVFIEEKDGVYQVQVDNPYLPRLRISPYYKNLLAEARKDPELRKYIKKKIDNAEWLLHAIYQRSSTLQRVAEEVVQHQQDYFRNGIRHLRPLKMQEIADKIGVNVSTVSRAISGKYFQAPGSIKELKFLFTGGTTKDDGSMESRGSVIERIKGLIGDEDKAKPLSDSKIVSLLGKEGIHISRRTVTKYREAEGIPSSRERRVY